ncbi:MAG: hypothetical protein ACR2NM_15250, partial [Bythopirellula sp.]
HETRQLSAAKQAEATTRIRKIVLNQGDDARALANLVQLTRNLPTLTTSQLYLDLADDYLRLGKYNQAANVLQQHITQYPDQPLSAAALVTLMRLYSSSEVSHTQQSSAGTSDTHQSFLKYANFFGDQTVHKNSALADDPALTFQRSVSTRLTGRAKAAQGRLTQLRHQTDAGIWRTRARAEHWLFGNRQEAPPLSVLVCRHTADRPHLDGALTDSLWLQDAPVQFAYDEEFLYLAVQYDKVAGQLYQADSRPRTYDADLSKHDHVQFRFDLDRDYATSFDLAVDSRGWTTDRCWLDASWNPKWFVATGGDETQWTVEAAIPRTELQGNSRQQAGDAWAICWRRVLPDAVVPAPPAEAGAPGEAFQLLVFE